MNRKFKDFSPRAVLWLGLSLLESIEVYMLQKSAPGTRITHGNKGHLPFQGTVLQNMGISLRKANSIGTFF